MFIIVGVLPWSCYCCITIIGDVWNSKFKRQSTLIGVNNQYLKYLNPYWWEDPVGMDGWEWREHLHNKELAEEREHTNKAGVGSRLLCLFWVRLENEHNCQARHQTQPSPNPVKPSSKSVPRGLGLTLKSYDSTYCRLRVCLVHLLDHFFNELFPP